MSRPASTDAPATGLPTPTERPAAPVGPPAFDPSTLIGRVPHAEPMLRRVTRAVLTALGSTTKDSRELEQWAAAAQRPVPTGRRIAVASVRGGSGKSTVAVLLGLVYAARRRDAVLLADADPEAGSLAWRLGLVVGSTMDQLAPALSTPREDLGSLIGLLPRTPGGLWLLPGGSRREGSLARDLTRAMSRLFGVCVTDCGRDMSAPATAAVLAEAHGVALVAPANPEGAQCTRSVLEQVGSINPASLGRVVVVLNTLDATGRAALNERAARAAFAAYRVPVVAVPYDRHLAAGAAIDAGRIAQRQGTTKEIGSIGAMLVRDHRDLDRKLTALAERLSVEVPNAPSARQRLKADELKSASGRMFDLDWLTAMTAAHERLISATNTEISKGTTPAVKDLAKSTLPVLQRHLTRIKVAEGG